MRAQDAVTWERISNTRLDQRICFLDLKPLSVYEDIITTSHNIKV